MNFTAARVPVWVHTKAALVLSQFRKGVLPPPSRPTRAANFAGNSVLAVVVQKEWQRLDAD